MRFRLDGVDEALRNLTAIEEAVSEPALQADGLEVLEPVVKDAQSLAPVDQGDLRDSIEAAVLDDGSVGVIIRDWKGHFFEFGTAHMRATPMLIPAWDANVNELSNAFADRIRVRIEAAPRVSRSRVGLRTEGF